MASQEQDFSHYGFFKTFLLPALLIFLLPILSWLFFRHAISNYDAKLLVTMREDLAGEKELSEEDRAAWLEVIEKVPFSEMLENPEFAAGIDESLKFDYANFRWMKQLAFWSIVSAVAVFLLAGICVLFSLRSQRAQYLSLSVGWHVLRIYGALQTIAQGVLLVALSFWCTAVWGEVYYVKLIFIAAFLAIAAVFVLIKAIFKSPETEFEIEGEVIRMDTAPELWRNLAEICKCVGTELPDQVVAGIDANFFVTSQAVTLDEKTLTGRTLYVSLSLLKKLSGSEANAIMAHEMAHFSGEDTTYSKKISPLLIRYDHYLQALNDGGVTIPIFYFMLCFRGFYELSIRKISREREFRADRIASEVTSPEDVASSLLRVIAYAKYRGTVEEDLFNQEEALEVADISERIEQGFASYLIDFISNEDLDSLEVFHPFDSHPPLVQRLAEVGVSIDEHNTQSLLNRTGAGSWYQDIRTAEQLEREQWDVHEENFRKFHEEVLAHRYLPENETQSGVVQKFYPECTFEGKKGTVVIDHEKIYYSEWEQPLLWSLLESCVVNDNGVLEMTSVKLGKLKLKTRSFGSQKQEVLDTFSRYWSRFQMAQEYQKQKAAESLVQN